MSVEKEKRLWGGVKDSESFRCIRSRLVIASDIRLLQHCLQPWQIPRMCPGFPSPSSDALALFPCTKGCSVTTPWKNSLWHPSIWGSVLFLPRVRLWSCWCWCGPDDCQPQEELSKCPRCSQPVSLLYGQDKQEICCYLQEAPSHAHPVQIQTDLGWDPNSTVKPLQ